MEKQIVAKLKKRKILILGAFPPVHKVIYGGVLTSCRVLINSSFSTAFDLVLIDSTQISNPPPSLIIRTLLAFRRLYRFIRALFKTKPDAVLLITALGASVLEKGLMAWLARFRSIPVFMFPRGSAIIDIFERSRFKRIWISTALRGATHFLCQGPAWQRFAINRLGFSLTNAPIIPNWTATDSFFSIGKGRTTAMVKSNPQILFLGWLEKEKGVFELLDACLALSVKFQFVLVVAGLGKAEAHARSFVNSHNLLHRVKFVGWVQGKTKAELLSNSDILVLPSWTEGFPNAIIEAMAAKVAVIVTRVGSVPDIITDRQEALLIPPKNTKALVKAIEVFLSKPKYRAEIANRGYLFAKDNFSAEQNISKLTAIFEEALSKNET